MLELPPTFSERRSRNATDRWKWLKYIGSGLLALIIFATLVRAVFAPTRPRPEETSTEGWASEVPQPHGHEHPAPEETEKVELVEVDDEPSQLPSEEQDVEGEVLEAGQILTLNSEHEAQEYVVITSSTTRKGQWFGLDWGKDYDGFNPNFVPHPVLEDMWYMFAVGLQSSVATTIPGMVAPIYSVELYCEARFVNDTLTCVKSPLQVPIGSTTSPYCTDGLEGAYLIIGPAETRVFVGEEGIPYVMWVSPSQHACSGPHLQDLRRLVQWYTLDAINLTNAFFFPTDLQRPPPRNYIEKNWFVFWDAEGGMYLHYDIWPKRAFAKLEAGLEGGVGEDLALLAEEKDARCMEKFMPKPVAPKEKIHQCSNSLALVLCKRADPDCVASEENTVILAIFQHKKYYGHNLYEPYVALLRNRAPFEMYGIGAKPLWISGRGLPERWDSKEEDFMANGQSQMMYIQSINWRDRGVGYTGYLDDVIMVAFGVEDKSGGGIDVVAEQLVKELNLCD